MALGGLSVPPLVRRDTVISAVVFFSWISVAWRATREHGDERQALLAWFTALLCLWPLPLAFAHEATYRRLREWLVPAHLAAQHWIGLRFTPPAGSQHMLSAPAWARSMLPVFLATFCQPWLYLAFGSCLQRTRLTTFMLTQPLLLAPVLFMARSHCIKQLDASPEAATHLQHISAALDRLSLLPPLGLHIGSSSGAAAGSSTGAAAAAAAGGGSGAAPAFEVMRDCEAVHMWLVILLAFCLPAIIIHRLEGQEQQARRPRRRTLAARRGGGAGGGRDGTWDDGAAGGCGGLMLLQAPQSLLSSAAELALAGVLAWLGVQVAAHVLLT